MGQSVVAFALLSVGCAPAPQRETVFVDLGAVDRAFPEPAPVRFVGQEDPPPIPGLKIDIPPLPPTTLSSPKGKDEVQIRASIEAARQKAQRQLQNRLRDVYFEELDRQQEEAIAGLNPALAAEADKARQKQLELFHKYADDKGFRLARLTLLAGFPDPDPKSLNPKPEFAIAKRFREEADRIRKELVKIDADYDAAVRQIFSELQGSHDQTLTNLKAKFVEAKGAAEEKAKAEATRQMARLNRAFGQTLAEEREVSVPGQPGKTLQAPTIDVRAQLPKIHPDPAPFDRKGAIRNQLTIWEAVKGYRIVTSSGGSRDGTSEFLEWLRSHLPGP